MSDNVTNHLEAATIGMEMLRNARAFVLITYPDEGGEITAAASMLLLNNLEERGFQEIVLETTVNIFGGIFNDNDNI